MFAGWEMLAPRLGNRRVRTAVAAAVAGLLLALGSASFVQTRVWRDAESLFAHSVSVIPDNAVMRPGIARCYLGAGRSDEARHMLEGLR